MMKKILALALAVLMVFALAFIRFTDYSVFYLFLICVAAALIRSALLKRKEGKA